jgi:hypothetical protein
MTDVAALKKRLEKKGTFEGAMQELTGLTRSQQIAEATGLQQLFSLYGECGFV